MTDDIGRRPRPTRRSFLGAALAAGLGAASPRSAAGSPRAATGSELASTATTLPHLPWQLTARPWRPSGVDPAGFLAVGEWIARADARHQNSDGAIVDAYSGREQQYQTPYFAVSVAMLVAQGRAEDLLPQGIAAMERATWALAQGRSRIPENHGEFFLAALAKALPLYRPHVSAARHLTWQNRLRTPLSAILQGLTHNWRTYAMKGEWYRALNGLVDRATAVDWIEASWTGSQRARLKWNPWQQYLDRSGTPDTHVYDAAARSNLFALIGAGYDGPSRDEMAALLERGALTSLLMQEPSGQNPSGGRSGDHVWNDVYSGHVFAQMADHQRTRDPLLAGRFRRAALLNLKSIDRWRRPSGAYSVTKNHFDPAERVGYATYSWFQNYNGNVMFHSLESYELMTAGVDEQPAPSEIGGYGFATDVETFGSAFANAGGMHMQAALRGATELSYGQYWTVLGVTRFGRVGWDGRLGPSDGVREPGTGRAASFAPAFLEDGTWRRLGELAERYEGRATFEFVHPLLVRWSIEYRPRAGRSGPAFRHSFVMTPDAVLCTLTSTAASFGVTLPVLEDDGRQLTTSYGDGIARTSYPWLPDEQNYIALRGEAVLETGAARVRGGVGSVRPALLTVPGSPVNEVLVYPRNASDPSGASVRSSFVRSGADFTTSLGRVEGKVYVGRTSAGGFAREVDIEGDGRPEVRFDEDCNVVLQLDKGRVVAVEVDRPVMATLPGCRLSLDAHRPLRRHAGAGMSATASSAQQGRPAAAVLDGDPATRWSAEGSGAWLTLDLGAETPLAAVVLSWYRGAERVATFDLRVSADGATWRTAAEGLKSSGTTSAPQSFALDGLSARHVRVVNRGNTENLWIALTSVEVWTG